MTQVKSQSGEEFREAIHTLRTVVTDKPLFTSVSAIHPPMFAKTAIVSQGRTQNNPDSVRLNFKTYYQMTDKSSGKKITRIRMALIIVIKHHFHNQSFSELIPKTLVLKH